MRLFWRWIPPIFLFAVAAFTWNYNETHTGSAYLFPFLDLIPGMEGDIGAQAELSWKIVAGMGGFAVLLGISDTIRDFRAKDEDGD